MAAPPPQAFHLMDLRDDERQLFADVHESTFVTTLVDYEPGKPLGDSASDSYLDNLVPQKPMSVSLAWFELIDFYWEADSQLSNWYTVC